ncbi:LacI family DNA-binding transcriptional regulator [Maricaulis sp.]|uniref:LacI family DNA-binding transcriptional regulator n=1 Tax=Maricaulis sp. TaxID=1486257 RepID=UPI002B27A843|nr:LacI family DNA-binding transcriptional regulator [Maricaulis sp.]
MSVKTRANKQSGATIKDVASAAGVSAMTVSRVLNAEPNVRPATRERVQLAIRDLNYRPNLSARNLARANAYFIGLLYDNPSAGYISELLIGALNRCRASGYHLVLENCDASGADWASQISSMLRTSSFDGIIMPPPVCDNADVLAAVAEAGIPCVRIAPDTDLDRSPCILTDDRAAARRMTEYLIDLGHSRIGFVRGPKEHGASRERCAGHLEALAAHGLESDPELLVAGEVTYKSGLEAAETLLSRDDRPSAIFASNDDMAVAVIALAHRHGLDVPRDLTVVGFDDTPMATAIWPQLTTVRQPISDMSSNAIELLASHLDGDADAAAQREIRSEIVVRDSSGAPAG